jgi:hypothetical protein
VTHNNVAGYVVAALFPPFVLFFVWALVEHPHAHGSRWSYLSKRCARASFWRMSRSAAVRLERGRIHLVGDRDDLRNIHEVGYLLSIWGGEAINMEWHTRSPESRRLELIGTPSVVVVLFDPAVDDHRSHPGLTAAAATRVGGEPQGTSITCTVPLAADRIEAIEQPDSPFWNKRVGWAPPTHSP